MGLVYFIFELFDRGQWRHVKRFVQREETEKQISAENSFRGTFSGRLAVRAQVEVGRVFTIYEPVHHGGRVD